MLSKDHRCRPTLKQVIKHPWLNKEKFNERFVTLELIKTKYTLLKVNLLCLIYNFYFFNQRKI